MDLGAMFNARPIDIRLPGIKHSPCGTQGVNEIAGYTELSPKYVREMLRAYLAEYGAKTALARDLGIERYMVTGVVDGGSILHAKLAEHLDLRITKGGKQAPKVWAPPDWEAPIPYEVTTISRLANSGRKLKRRSMRITVPGELFKVMGGMDLAWDKLAIEAFVNAINDHRSNDK